MKRKKKKKQREHAITSLIITTNKRYSTCPTSYNTQSVQEDSKED